MPQTDSVEGSAVFTKEENKIAKMTTKGFKFSDQLLNFTNLRIEFNPQNSKRTIQNIQDKNHAGHKVNEV